MTSAVPVATDPRSDGDRAVPFVHVENMVKQFGEVTAVTDLSLDLHHNEFVSVVGASG